VTYTQKTHIHTRARARAPYERPEIKTFFL